MHRLLGEPLVQMTKPINRNQFLVGNPARLRIVTGSLKTSRAPLIVKLAGKCIELNELEYRFHTTILLV